MPTLTDIGFQPITPGRDATLLSKQRAGTVLPSSIGYPAGLGQGSGKRKKVHISVGSDTPARGQGFRRETGKQGFPFLRLECIQTDRFRTGAGKDSRYIDPFPEQIADKTGSGSDKPVQHSERLPAQRTESLRYRAVYNNQNGLPDGCRKCSLPDEEPPVTGHKIPVYPAGIVSRTVRPGFEKIIVSGKREFFTASGTGRHQNRKLSFPGERFRIDGQFLSALSPDLFPQEPGAVAQDQTVRKDPVPAAEKPGWSASACRRQLGFQTDPPVAFPLKIDHVNPDQRVPMLRFPVVKIRKMLPVTDSPGQGRGNRRKIQTDEDIKKTGKKGT